MTLKSSLSRNLFVLSAVSFLNDLSSELIMAVLPFFLLELGGGAVAVGLLGGLREALSNFLKLPAGYLSDKLKEKKPFIIAGYGISALFKLLLALSKSPAQAILFSSLERLGKGIRTAPRDALLSYSGNVARSFSIHRAFDTLGALSGSLFAFLLVGELSNREIISVGALLTLLSIPLLFLLKEEERERGKEEEKSDEARALKLLVPINLFYFSFISFVFFLLKAKEVTGSEKDALLLYALYNLTYATSSLTVPSLFKRLGALKGVALGYATSAVFLLSLAISSSIELLILSTLLFGMASGITDPGNRSLVSLLSGKEKRGTAYGIFHTTVGLSSLIGNLTAGFFWSSHSTWLLFAYSAVALISSFLLVKLSR
jgi:MFS family permease